MDHNERFNQLESLMADMLRRMDQFTAALQHTNQVMDSIVEVIKIADQRSEKVEEILLRHDERFRRSEERQDATLRLLQQQSENLTAAFRSLEAHDGRLQKLEGQPGRLTPKTPAPPPFPRNKSSAETEKAALLRECAALLVFTAAPNPAGNTGSWPTYSAPGPGAA